MPDATKAVMHVHKGGRYAVIDLQNLDSEGKASAKTIKELGNL